MSLNKVMLIGNVGKDPEVRHLDSGVATTTISIATSESYTDKTTGQKVTNTEWHNVVLWRQLAEVAERYIRKGTQIFVEGKLRTRSWEDRETGQKRYVTEIVADNIRLLGKREENPAVAGTGGYYAPSGQPTAQQPASYGNAAPQSAAAPQSQPQPAAETTAEGDDLPF